MCATKKLNTDAFIVKESATTYALEELVSAALEVKLAAPEADIVTASIHRRIPEVVTEVEYHFPKRHRPVGVADP